VFQYDAELSNTIGARYTITGFMKGTSPATIWAGDIYEKNQHLATMAMTTMTTTRTIVRMMKSMRRKKRRRKASDRSQNKKQSLVSTLAFISRKFPKPQGETPEHSQFRCVKPR
jgi:hypothetical protein